ncbi:hypothetical protein ACHAW6_007918 [Cyclotella cf. meneghiniana]
MGYPVISTWCKAINKGYFQVWNGLISERVGYFIKPSEYNLMGHLDQKHKGIRSAKSSTNSSTPGPMAEPPHSPLYDKTNMVFKTMVDIEGQLFTDQTGQLPVVTSNRGNNYIVIFYTVNAHHIKSYPIKSCHRTELLHVYNNVYAYLRMQGYRPQLQKLDNESSHNVETFITDKNHFVAMRAGTAKSYRLSNWCKYLEQTGITLSMMCPCTQNSNLSAHKALEGMFLFDAMPMAPIGTECMIHTKLVHRHIWGYHVIKALYFAPALNHYRCIKAVTDTGAVCITDTYTFLHHTLTTPTISNPDRITKEMKHLEHTINGHIPTQQAITPIRNLIIGTDLAPDVPSVVHTKQQMTTYHAPAQCKQKHTNHTQPPPLHQQTYLEPIPTLFPLNHMNGNWAQTSFHCSIYLIPIVLTGMSYHCISDYLTALAPLLCSH